MKCIIEVTLGASMIDLTFGFSVEFDSNMHSSGRTQTPCVNYPEYFTSAIPLALYSYGLSIRFLDMLKDCVSHQVRT